MQEGLRLKQRLCENHDFVTGEAAKTSSMSNLLVKSVDFGAKNQEKKHFYFSDVKKFIESKKLQQEQETSVDFDLSFSINAFSTPVRASFRQKRLLNGGVANKRRWSNIELEKMQKEFLDFEPTLPVLNSTNLDVTDFGDLPSVAVDGTETQLLVESFNNNLPLKRDAEDNSDGKKRVYFGRGRILHDQSTLLSQSKEFLDFEPTLPMLNSTNLDGPDFRGLPSVAVDGTETQLLVESFNNNLPLKRDAEDNSDGKKRVYFGRGRILHDQSTLLSQSMGQSSSSAYFTPERKHNAR